MSLSLNPSFTKIFKPRIYKVLWFVLIKLGRISCSTFYHFHYWTTAFCSCWYPKIDLVNTETTQNLMSNFEWTEL